MSRSMMMIVVFAYGFISGSVAYGETVTWNYQGINFENVFSGTNFTTSDSVSGSLTISDPQTSGSCSGVGTDPAECNVTAVSMTATSSTTPVTFSGLTHANSLSSWTFTFDASNNITAYALEFVGDVAGGAAADIIAVQSSQVLNAFQIDAILDLSHEGVVGSNNPGTWTIVPEPGGTSLALCALGMMSAVRGRMRRRSR